MDFRIITPVTYWMVIVVWIIVFVFYIRKLSSKKTSDKFFRLLLIILAIDAFRTLFESIYFGAWYTSLSDILPIYIYDYLAQPKIVFFPKIVNLFTSLLVLFLIIRKWLPEESNRIETLNSLLSEKTKKIEASNLNLRTEAQQARESEENYRKATINSPFPIMIHAEGGEVLLINKSWVEITGYELEEINTISKWTEKAYGKKSSILKEYIDNLYEIGKSIQEGEFTIRTKDGEDRIWDFNSAPLDALPDGRRLIISSAVDITEKNKTSIQLKESEEQFRSIIEQASDAMCLSDFEGNILMVNNASCITLGYSKEEFYQMKVSDLDPNYGDLSKNEKLWNSLTLGEIQSVESTHKRKDGSIFPVEIRIGLYTIDGNKAILGFVRDITKYKESEIKFQKFNEELELHVAERTTDVENKNIELANIKTALLNIVEDLNEKSTQLEENTDTLQRTNKELEAFSYSVSHDLRAPLRGIHGFTQILMEDYSEKMDDEFKRICLIIWDNSQKMGQLIDDLLEFSRLSRSELQNSVVDMDGMANSIYYEITDEESRKRVDISIQNIGHAYGDPAMLKQVWANLLSNAIKFSSKKEKSIISVTCKIEENKYVYCISDNGAGFDMKYMNKLFGVFQRLHSTNEFEGTGVGLANVQRIITRHKGDVWAESELNKGAQFYFTLPK